MAPRPGGRRGSPITSRARPVFEALKELTEPLREALVAVDVVGLSYREAAHALEGQGGHDHEPAAPGPRADR